MPPLCPARIGCRFATLAVLSALAAGCSTPQGYAVGTVSGIAATTFVLGRTASNDIEQIYYLGVFDPAEQLPPSFYRVTVRGQASFISSTKFASGWAPAQLVDSLNTRIHFDDETGSLKMSDAESGKSATLQTGRRLVMFGPEGFREAPRDYRLVIVMGSNPSAYFQAVDEVLGVLAEAKRARTMTIQEQNQRILSAIVKAVEETDRLEKMKLDLALPKTP
ncbi:MAG: hypothetical protein HYZ53_04450 [Planctomycetes bacterium]|nr:hypothetical protein [Planctomycetota bacterium]